MATKAVLSIWPETGQLLGMGRDATYRAVTRGELPTIKVGRRRLVPVGRLAELLHSTPEQITAEVETNNLIRGE